MGLGKAKKRFCVLESITMIYFACDAKSDFKEVISDIQNLTDLTLKGDGSSFICGGRAWEFNGEQREINKWLEALRSLEGSG